MTKLDRTAEVVWDQRNDRWETGRRAWLAVDRTATHGLVLQDDAIIPRDLVAGIEQAMEHIPAGQPMCLYLGRTQPFRDLTQRLVARTDQHTSWVTMSEIHWGVGIVLPTELIQPCLAWCDTRPEITNYDRRIGRWAQHQGLTTYYPWPSLVDHRDSPSLVAGRGSAGRRAYKFIGEHASALDQPWDGQTVTLAALNVVTNGPLPSGPYKVVGHCAQASNGRVGQLYFRGAILPDGVLEQDLRHLMSVGLIEPVAPTGTSTTTVEA